MNFYDDAMNRIGKEGFSEWTERWALWLDKNMGPKYAGEFLADFWGTVGTENPMTLYKQLSIKWNGIINVK